MTDQQTRHAAIQQLLSPLLPPLAQLVADYADEVLVFVNGLDAGTQSFSWRCVEFHGSTSFSAETISLVSTRVAKRLMGWSDFDRADLDNTDPTGLTCKEVNDAKRIDAFLSLFPEQTDRSSSDGTSAIATAYTLALEDLSVQTPARVGLVGIFKCPEALECVFELFDKCRDNGYKFPTSSVEALITSINNGTQWPMTDEYECNLLQNCPKPLVDCLASLFRLLRAYWETTWENTGLHLLTNPEPNDPTA